VAASAILLDRHDPDQVAAGVLGGAGLLLVPVGLAAGVDWLGEPGGLAMAAWLGVVTVAVAYPLLTRGLSRIGVGATATLTLAEPATAATLGLVVLGERLRPLGWVGLALVGAGVLLETVGGARDREPPGGPGEP
jgi:drug/metabolite transporter, DME family